MELPSVRRVCMLTVITSISLLSLIYIMQNGFWKPMVWLRRATPVDCRDAWWPKGEVHLVPNISITDAQLGNECLNEKDPEGARTKLETEVKEFMSHINSLPKKYYGEVYISPPKNNSLLFQPIDFTRGYVISAFMERRMEPSPSVKILLIIPTLNPLLYCHTWCNGLYMSIKGTPSFLNFFKPVHKKCLWHQYVLHCLFPVECQVQTVSVTSATCLKPTNILNVLETYVMYKPRHSIGVCLNLIFNKKEESVSEILQFMETFRNFGGSVIYLYGTLNIDKKIQDVLNHYIRIGMVKYYNWAVPPGVTSLFYFGQVLQNMDCVYRHMRDVQHLLFLDLDEALYPLKHNTWQGMLNYLKNPHEAGLSIQRVKTDLLNGALMLSTETAASHFCIEVTPKPMVRPRMTVEVSVHFVEQALRPFHKVRDLEKNIGVIFHLKNDAYCTSYRTPDEPLSRLMNRTLGKWQPIIKKRMDKSLKEIRWSGT